MCQATDGSVIVSPKVSQPKFGFLPAVSQKKILGKEIEGIQTEARSCYLDMTMTGSVQLIVMDTLLIPYDIDDENYLSMGLECERNRYLYVIKNDEIIGTWFGGRFYKSGSEELKDFNLSIHVRLPEFDWLVTHLIEEAMADS